MVAHSSGK